MNNVKTGIAATVVWESCIQMLLVWAPGVSAADKVAWSRALSIVLVAGLVPAFLAGFFISRIYLRRFTASVLKAFK